MMYSSPLDTMSVLFIEQCHLLSFLLVSFFMVLIQLCVLCQCHVYLLAFVSAEMSRISGFIVTLTFCPGTTILENISNASESTPAKLAHLVLANVQFLTFFWVITLQTFSDN